MAKVEIPPSPRTGGAVSAKDGGPAFPVVGMQQINGQGVIGVFANGMTLRDYLAAKALQGLLRVNRPHDIGALRQEYADEAYLLADAMLKARES